MNPKSYIVIVYPVPPSRKDRIIASQSWPANGGPTIKTVTSRSAQAAADAIGVPPGAHALVFARSDGKRFDRPAQADLVEKRFDGNPLNLAT